MGQIVRRKRRGRPANPDRAHHNTAVTPPSPVDRRSSRRRRNVRYNFDIDDYVDDDEFYNNYEDDEDVVIGRREKKIRLSSLENDDDYSRSNRRVPNAPHSSHALHAPSSSSEDDDDDDEFNPLKKRKLDEEDNDIEEIRGRQLDDVDDDDDNGNNNDDEEEEEEEEEEAGGSDYNDCGTGSGRSKLVPLPDKRTLEMILDKLQKKDIYGVYAEPVDPDELPDYHDVIKHPMDFATVRKKLAKGSYLTLKDFERDIYLICSNAMQYNAPDTIYYKQASSIQEQAKLRFKRLKANVDRTEIELKTERKTLPSFSLPKKQLKKTVSRTTQDSVGSETFSDSTFRTLELPNGSSGQTPVQQNSFSGSIVKTKEILNCSSSQTPVRQNSCDGAENSSLPDDDLDKDQELLPDKGFMPKLGRKPSVDDENRRATYNMDVPPVTDSGSVLSTFEGESKQFIPVGLHVDLSYARSLARFAANLGSVAWKVASHAIEQALPEGVKFGRGWVDEYEPLPTPVPMPENRSLKEPDFLAHFNTHSDIKINEKTCTFTRSDNRNTPKNLVAERKLNDGFSPVKQETFKENSKDLSPRPPFFSSLQTTPGSNRVHQNAKAVNFTRPEKMGLPQVELNHPHPLYAGATDFVTRKPVSSTIDIPLNPVTRNGNLVSFESFKQSNSNNDGFVPGRPSKENPTPVAVHYNRMMCPENKFPRQHEQQVLSDPVQMMKSLTEKSRHQQNNSNGFGPKREDSNNSASTIHQFHSNSFQIGSRRQDSSNVGLTPAQQWMSLGAGGFVKPPLTENLNPYKQQTSSESMYNTDGHQLQVSRFHGEFPVPVVHIQPLNPFTQQVRTVNDTQVHFQNRNVSFPQMVPADLSRFHVQSSWPGVNTQMMQQQQPRPKLQESRPPDLNIGYQSITSPVRQSGGMLVDSQQPDLALQL